MRKFWLLIAAGLLAGHVLPWAQHNTAALTLSGHDLAIFLNDTPYAGGFANEWFYVPAWVAGLLMAFAANQSDRPLWQRLALGVLGACVASLGLPPYEKLRDILHQPDYQVRFAVSALVMLDCLVMAALRRPKFPSAYGAALAGLNVIPLYGFSLMRWPISQLYGNDVNFGLGWWLTLFTIALVIVFFVYGLVRARNLRAPAQT
ncbi:MAG TPA: hypothetical protein PLW39_14450 [Thermoflexales bacterium]|nr:hypothetical protein [Thermoflexales bacterium]